jgi:predicted metal-dependent hydrolase
MFGHKKGKIERKITDVIKSLQDLHSSVGTPNLSDDLLKSLIDSQIKKLQALLELSGKIHNLIEENI